MWRQTLQLIAPGALLLSGCMSAAEAAAVHDGVDEPQVEAVTQAPIALRAGASVGADEIDGYSENGIGVYLSADDVQAMLTVYVVTPAEQAVFMHPTLHLTTQKGDIQWTQDRVFDSVMLRAGESRTFAQEADGALMNVEAEVSAQ
jgi:PBP1b-binding outer membrane lipoprotein LpoB